MGDYDPEREDTTVYKVLINHEEQYSIWPEYKENPIGWTSVGKTGLEAECLDYINEVWTDMRPLGLRKKMQELAENPSPVSPPAPRRPRAERLVDRLRESDQPIEVVLRPEKSAKRFKEAIDRDYVHIKFTNTRGGTELGFSLDRDACDFSGADFDSGKGLVHLEGDLTVDYVDSRCIADIDLQTLEGKGCLVTFETAEDIQTPESLVNELSSQHFQLP